jgi:hypothetical protein
MHRVVLLPSCGNPAIRLVMSLTRGFASSPHGDFAFFAEGVFVPSHRSNEDAVFGGTAKGQKGRN